MINLETGEIAMVTIELTEEDYAFLRHQLDLLWRKQRGRMNGLKSVKKFAEADEVRLSLERLGDLKDEIADAATHR